jgi:formiminoglutamase
MKNMNKRFKDSIGAKFQNENSEVNFLCSASDVGVRRNLGRAGARFAPKVILQQFKKLNNHLNWNSYSQLITSDQNKELENFTKAQELSTEIIFQNLDLEKTYIHLGGGHDHAYPLLMALDKVENFKNILIINLDAHCDTRIDDKSHSGTPFRDYDLKGNKEFFLYQIGIHNFANSKETLSTLSRGKMFIDHYQINFSADHFAQVLNSESPFEINSETLIYLSLDCDALHSSIMPAVSAVNHHGLSLNFVIDLIQYLKQQNLKTIFGIYEYNPLFDDNAASSARAVSYLIHSYLS